MIRFDDKIILITGAGSGIGAACARQFAALGGQVIVTDANEANARAVADGMELPGRAEAMPLDVTDESAWRRTVDLVLARHERLDVLVNNAGILLLRSLLETSVEEWDEIFAVNARGVFLGIRAAAPALRSAGGGAIVNVSSIYGLVGPAGAGAYQATKGAVRLLTKNAAAELAQYNIRVNSVHPGVVDTPMTQHVGEGGPDELLGPTLLGRPARPEEIAGPIAFLASEAASYMTGSELVVDGGYTCQ